MNLDFSFHLSLLIVCHTFYKYNWRHLSIFEGKHETCYSSFWQTLVSHHLFIYLYIFLYSHRHLGNSVQCFCSADIVQCCSYFYRFAVSLRCLLNGGGMLLKMGCEQSVFRPLYSDVLER